VSAQPTDRRRGLRVAPAAGEQAALFGRIAELEADLKAIDAELTGHERIRDAAIAELAVEPRPPALRAWALEEQRDTAAEACAHLLERRRPIATVLGRLEGYAAPIRRELEEVARARAAVLAYDKLAEVFGLLDRALETIAEAEALAPDVGVAFEVPPSLRDLRRRWQPTAWTRTRVQESITANQVGARARVERHKGGQP
jgi:hypothetical protein